MMRKGLEAHILSICKIKKKLSSEISLVKQLSALFVLEVRNIRESKVMQRHSHFLYKKNIRAFECLK